MIAMTTILPTTPTDWAGHYRQGYWEIPAALRNVTLWNTPYFDDQNLYDWVVSNRDGIKEDIFLVGPAAEEVAAGLVLDLARQPGVFRRYGQDLLAWSDQGQIVASRRDNREAREVLEFLERAHVLVVRLPELGDRQYSQALDRLLQVRSKRRERATVMWAPDYVYDQYSGLNHGLAVPVHVDAA